MKLVPQSVLASVATFAAAALVASSASAQQAVQWRVEDGGNGHWYAADLTPRSWTDAETAAVERGGHLASISSANENAFVFSVVTSANLYLPWLGGFQDFAAADYSEPAGGWRWVDGEAWLFTNWDPNQPDNAGAAEHYLQCWGGDAWNDQSVANSFSSITEWSADCNNDGIVDYGQCRDGSLPDYNANNIPDCCEFGEPCVEGSYPVQWRVEDGGNGHWYKRVNSEVEVTWTFSRDAALAAGGHLVTLVSAAEQAWAKAALVDGHPVCQIASWAYPRSAWIGVFQDVTSPSYSEPAGGWRWVTDEPLEFTNWEGGAPGNVHGAEFGGIYFDGIWACSPDDAYIYCYTGYIIEWSADCNNDGIVDYGQILDGSLADLDANGVPDICDCGGLWDRSQSRLSGELAPFAPSVPETFVVSDISPSSSGATLQITARGNLGTNTKFLTVRIDGQILATNVFGAGSGAGNCTVVASVATLQISAEQFDALTDDGQLIIKITPSALATSEGCTNATLTAQLDWQRDLIDCNGNELDDECEMQLDPAQLDCDDNGLLDDCQIAAGAPDVNGNGRLDSCEPDCNGNGLPDSWEVSTGLVPDCNSNGQPDSCDVAAGGGSSDVDQNGVPDECKADCNNNDLPDAYEIALNPAMDCDGNGVPDVCQLGEASPFPGAVRWSTADGGNGHWYKLFGAVGQWPQARDACLAMGGHLATVTSAEENAFVAAVKGGESAFIGGVRGATPSGWMWVTDEPWGYTNWAPGQPDNAWWIGEPYLNHLENHQWNDIYPDPYLPFICEWPSWIPADGPVDCDGNKVLDTCDIASNPDRDCNSSGVLDSCEIAADPTADCNGNGVPDSCDIVGGAPDCNGNAVPDSCDIAANPGIDCDGNNVLDTCDLAVNPGRDCNGNGSLDACDVMAGAEDENANGIPDSCELAAGDFDLDGNVGGSDLAAFLSLWGAPGSPYGDLNGDGELDGADLTSLLTAWGSTGWEQPASPPWATVLARYPSAAVVTSAELRRRIAGTNLPWRVVDNATQIEFVLIPPGTFNMGCSASNQYGCDGDENPVHQVTLTNALYLGRYEVTQAQWQATMGNNPSYWQGDSNRPVEQVSWNTIQGFLSATGMRLPTEAEWEYACRGGTTTAFHGWPANPSGTNDDNQVGNIAWYYYNTCEGGTGCGTRAVGQKAANGFGLHDMSGNVWEWVNDWYGGYSGEAQTNPQGPSSGSSRVLRGGSWGVNSDVVRSSLRDYFGSPDDSSDTVGFRASRTPYETPAVASIAPASGVDTGGTEITISGSFLGGTTAVTIGGVPATNVQVVDASTVTAITPPGSVGSVDVVLSCSKGTVTVAGGFTYVGVPAWATLIEAAPDPAVVYDEAQRAAIIATGLAWRVRDTATQIEFVLIPPGTFNMGCSASNLYACESDGRENPVHQVTLTNAFYLGRYEVTQAQWQATMGNNPSYWQGDSNPVEQVSWDTIQGFLSATGMRLPTEAEWEYACRAGTTTAFHGWAANPSGTNDDNQVGNIAWFDANSGWETHPVGGKAGNGFGLHDMGGNVWEWVNDWYSSSYYASSPAQNPQGPSSGSTRVLRGSSWTNNSNTVRSSYRNNHTPDYSNNAIGFRASRTPYETPAVTSITPASGVDTGGTEITISGSFLGGTTAVTIGGLPATNVQVVDASTVTAITPPGSVGSVDVVLSCSKGTVTVAGGFTYVGVPAWATLIEAAPDPAVVYDEAQRAAIIATGLPWRVKDTATQIEFLLIPPGTFNMGCSASNQYACQSNENPVHEVTLTNAYYMGRYEVTQAQWQATMGNNPSYFVAYPNSDSRPVERVGWDTIQGFLSATGTRLPTEAEWEYACRAGTTAAYHGWPANPSGTNDDNQVGNIAWYNGNEGGQTRPVGGKAANGFGLHDMSGNVWECVNDRYGDYSADEQTNPQGPSSGSYRVLRGGAWYSSTDGVRASFRSDDTLDGYYGIIGFRASRTP